MEEQFDMGNGNILEVERITYEADDPRAWDNMTKMYCFHRNYRLGDDHSFDPDNYDSFDDMIETEFNTDDGEDIVTNLYLYDHGSITISTAPFNCRWDSGQLGFIVITKETIIKEFGDNSKDSRIKAMHNLACEVNTYDQYLRGDVYMYRIKNSEGVVLDDCYGFFGDDHTKSGLFDCAGFKAKETA